jgi:hypothetical protein
MTIKALHNFCLASATLALFSSCAHKNKELTPMTQKGIRTEVFYFKDLPSLEGSNDKIKLGGFSGLAYEGVNPTTGRKSFLTHTDRGPNSEQEFTKEGLASRRFGLSTFNPLLVRFEIEEKTMSAEITETLPLKSSKGAPISGLPNLSPNSKRKDTDEVPLSEKGEALEYNPSGLDLEGVVRTEDGSYWMVEEYRPSILHFSKDGKLLTRYIPAGSKVKGMDAAKEELPAALKNRQMNRGFEGIAIQDGKVFAFLQSPLNPKGVEIPVIEFDTRSKKVLHTHTYKLESNKADKIGDAVSIGKNKFLVIEQNSKTNEKSFRKIFQVTLSKGQALEKKLIADLSELGFSKVEKFEV